MWVRVQTPSASPRPSASTPTSPAVQPTPALIDWARAGTAAGQRGDEEDEERPRGQKRTVSRKRMLCAIAWKGFIVSSSM